jgi:hypothetical protein
LDDNQLCLEAVIGCSAAALGLEDDFDVAVSDDDDKEEDGSCAVPGADENAASWTTGESRTAGLGPDSAAGTGRDSVSRFNRLRSARMSAACW